LEASHPDQDFFDNEKSNQGTFNRPLKRARTQEVALIFAASLLGDA